MIQNVLELYLFVLGSFHLCLGIDCFWINLILIEKKLNQISQCYTNIFIPPLDFVGFVCERNF